MNLRSGRQPVRLPLSPVSRAHCYSLSTHSSRTRYGLHATALFEGLKPKAITPCSKHVWLLPVAVPIFRNLSILRFAIHQVLCRPASDTKTPGENEK